MANEIFISYSRKDADFVKKLFTRLKAAGIDCWIDFEDIEPGAKWQQEILIACQACHNFIFCLSPNSLRSDYCEWELNHALMHDKRVLPIVVEPCIDELIFPALKELNWIFFDKNFQDGLKLLLRAIDAPIGISHGARLDSKIELIGLGFNRIFYLYRNRYLIGRNPLGNLQKEGIILVPDRWVSRNHVTLQRSPSRWAVLDNHSRNGAFLGSRRLPPGELWLLRHGDEVRLSPDVYICYQELYAAEHDPAVVDDKETYTGE
jgi:hypothetical protein